MIYVRFEDGLMKVASFHVYTIFVSLYKRIRLEVIAPALDSIQHLVL